MSLKQVLKKLENQLSKGSESSVAVVTPYIRDAEKSRALQEQMIREHALEGVNQVVFVVDFSSPIAA